jgi:hypothetical protein
MRKMNKKIEEEFKIIISVASVKSLDFKLKNPHSEIKDVITNVLNSMRVKDNFSRVLIMASISRTMKYYEKSPFKSYKEIVQKVISESNEIINFVDVDLE